MEVGKDDDDDGDDDGDDDDDDDDDDEDDDDTSISSSRVRCVNVTMDLVANESTVPIAGSRQSSKYMLCVHCTCLQYA